MPLLPKSRKARRRLMVLGAAAPILAAAVGLSLYAMGDAAVFFYSPSEAQAKNVPPGKTVRIGGVVQPGSVARMPDGVVQFRVADNSATALVSYQGDLPDLFREGQGIVAQGEFAAPGQFRAQEVLAKHDENYMPKEVADALKASGEWQRGTTPGTVASQ